MRGPCWSTQLLHPCLRPCLHPCLHPGSGSSHASPGPPAVSCCHEGARRPRTRRGHPKRRLLSQPLLGCSLLALRLLFSPPRHPGGLQPAPQPRRGVLPLLCPRWDDSRVLGPAICLAGRDRLPSSCSSAVSPPLVPGPHLALAPFQGQQGRARLHLLWHFPSSVAVWWQRPALRRPLPPPSHPASPFHGTVPAQGPLLPRSGVGSSLLPRGRIPTAVLELGGGPPAVLGSWLPPSPTTSHDKQHFPPDTAPPHFRSWLGVIQKASCEAPVRPGHLPGASGSSATPRFLLLSQLEDSSSTFWPQPS